MSHRLRAMAGSAAIIAGVLFVLSEVGYFVAYAGTGENAMAEVVGTPMHLLASVLFMLGMALAIPGVMGIYRQQAEQAGAFGLVAAAVFGAGLFLAAGATWTEVFTAPWIASNAPELFANEPGGTLALGFMVSFITLGAGVLLFGISLLLARVYPRWMAVLMTVAGLVAVVPFVPGGQGVVAGIAIGSLGVGLRRQVQVLEAAEADPRSPAAPAATA